MIAGTACRFAGERPWKRSGKCLILCANSIGLARLPIGHKALITVGVAMVGANTHRRPPPTNSGFKPTTVSAAESLPSIGST